jgi:hypothetical protein
MVYLGMVVPYGFDILCGGFPHLTNDFGNLWIRLPGILRYNGSMVVLPEEDESCSQH